jgi:hypothetical protein
LNNHSQYYETINAQPNNQQAVSYNISNAGNNYVNHAIIATTPETARAECPTEHADSQKQARPPLLPPLDAQHNVTRLTDTSHMNLKNLMGFDQGNIARTMVDAQSLTKKLWQE